MNSVLIIDDDRDVRRIAELSFQAHDDWRVASCSNGIEGLELLERESIDIVLVDMMMPGMDGLATFDAIRAKRPTLPVVFMTARVQPHEVAGYMERGATFVVAKPFDPLELPSKLAALIDGGASVASRREIDPLEKVTRRFQSRLPARIADIRCACERASRGNSDALEQARQLTHKLRGTAGSYGEMELSRYSGELEELLRTSTETQGGRWARVRELVDSLERTMDATRRTSHS